MANFRPKEDIIERLLKLERESIQRGIPIIGQEKGRWLYQKVKEIKPKKVLELGTANGYSGIILGSEGALLTTIDINERIAKEAKNNFDAFNIKAKIIIGDAKEEVKQLVKQQEQFDLIFLDHMKRQYLAVLEDCIKLVKKKGFIIADNISSWGCRDYKERIMNHPNLKTEIINIYDGLSCSQKV